MICTLAPNSGRMRAPITVEAATLEPITSGPTILIRHETPRYRATLRRESNRRKTRVANALQPTAFGGG